MKKLFSICILLCLVLKIFAQTRQIYSAQLPLSKEFGGGINCFFQDKTGFIWIGKETGLYRYDGHNVKTFRFDANNPQSIGNNNVIIIEAGPDDDLWIGTRGGGLNRYHQKTGTFTRYLHDKNDTSSISFDEVQTLCPDGKGNLLVGTDGGGINLFNLTTGKFRCLDIGLKTNNVLHISPLDKERFWVSTWLGGLYIFEPALMKITPLGQNTPFEKISAFCVKEVKPGIYWIAAYDKGLLEYNLATNSFTVIVPNNLAAYVKDIKTTKNGEVFVASFSGLLYFPIAGPNYTIYNNTLENISISVNKLFIDRSLNLWLGTINEYIGNLNLCPKKFSLLNPTSPYSALPIYSIKVNNVSNQLFFTTTKQLVAYHLKNNTFQTFPIPFTSYSRVVFLPKSNAIICSSQTNLLGIDLKTQKAMPLKFSNNFSDLFTSVSLALFPADSTGFWLSGLTSAYRIAPETNGYNWHAVEVLPHGVGGISKSHNTTCYLQMPNGDLWIGTWGGGLNYRKAGQKKIKQFQHNINDKNTISNNFIECITADKNGNVWIGTQVGLNRFDVKTNTFKSLTTNDGLDGDWIKSVIIDHRNRAWVCTRSRIVLVSNNFSAIRNYGLRDGLGENSFFSNAVASDNNGNIYFGTSRGITWFHPDSIQNNPLSPSPAIVGFKINNIDVPVSAFSPLKQQIEFTSEIKMLHKQSTVSFQLAALSFTNPKMNQIKYKLIGYDANWNLAGADQVASYTNLPWGNYTFSVMAANEDGVWNPNAKNIRIGIAPPWWLSAWAIFFYALMLVGAVFIYLNFIRRKKAGTSPTLVPPKNKKAPNPELVQPGDVEITSAEIQFLKKAVSMVEENISNPDFGVDELAEKLNLGQRQLYRKINHISGLTVTEFIKEVRLKRAAQLILQKPGNISEIAYQVGFNDPKYFSKCFKQKFGVSPNQYTAPKV